MMYIPNAGAIKRKQKPLSYPDLPFKPTLNKKLYSIDVNMFGP